MTDKTFQVGDGHVTVSTGEVIEISGSGGGGKGGGGGRAAQEAANTLRSNALVRIVEVLSEGPIAGICGGGQGVYLNDTPLYEASGTSNFPGASWDYRVGLPDQDVMPGYSAAEAEFTVNATVLQATPVTRTTSTVNIDALKVTLQFPNGLYTQNTSNGDLNGGSVTITIEKKLTSSGAWASASSGAFNGKTTSPYEWQGYIPRPAGTGTWDVRVTRITADDANASSHSNMVFARMTEVQEVKDGSTKYNDTAVVGLLVDAQTVGNTIPVRSYLVKGMLVSIPSNYDPVTHVYTGTWNGTFQTAWTDNPAWCLYDLITNPRYGMGEFISASRVDKYSFYDAAVYNDASIVYTSGGVYVSGGVSDGKGGFEPRFTFNAVIASRDDGIRVLQMVAGCMRGTLIDVGGLITLLQDRPSTPVRLITKANVIDGLFNYKSSGLFERHTAFNVTFNDREDRYLQRICTIDASTTTGAMQTALTAAQTRYGYNPLDIAAFGSTTESQALRQGRWAVDTEINQTEIGAWKMSLNGFDLVPGNIVKVYDEDYTAQVGAGRIVSASGSTVVLDRQVDTTSGGSIDIMALDGTGGIYMVNRTYNAVGGLHNTLTVTLPYLDSFNAGADFIITNAVAPRQFKIVGVKQDDASTVSIEAIYHDPNKYSRVETGLSIAAPLFNNTVDVTCTAPASMAFKESSVNIDNTIKRSLLVSWTPPSTNNASFYTLAWRVSGGQWSTVTPLTTMAYELVNINAGTYEVNVYATSMWGNQGPAMNGTYTIATAAGGVSSLYAPTTLVEQTSGGTSFGTGDLNFKWTNPGAQASVTNATLRDFEVRIINLTGLVTVRTFYVASVAPGVVQSSAYSYAQNMSDFANVATRSFKIEVRCRDTNGNLSAPIATTFTNAAPAVPSSISVSGGLRTTRLTFTAPTDLDYAGVMVWGSTTTGFTPGPANLLYDGRDNYISFSSLNDLTPYYYKVGAYDTFAKDTAGAGMNLSAEYTATTSASPGIAGVASLPGSSTEGTVVFNTTDGQLYRWHSGAWTNAVPAVNVTGTLTDAQLAAISAAKVTGTLVDAQIAGMATSKLAGTITDAQIAGMAASKVTGTLTSSQIASLAASQITGTLTSSQIASLSATQITGTLTNAQLAAIDATKVTGTLSDAQLSAISATKITGALTSAQISSLSATQLTGLITTTQITDGSISTAKLAAGSVTAATIATDTITATQIAANAITSSELAAGAVIAGKITAGTIVSGDIAALTITGGNIAAATISAGKFVAGSIVAGDIAAGTITGAKIAAGTIVASNLLAGTITANEIAASTITGAKIAAGTIAASNLVANTITAGQIAAGTLTATQIAAGTITGANIAAGTVLATNIAAKTISVDKLMLSNTNNICSDPSMLFGGLGWNGVTHAVVPAASAPASCPTANAMQSSGLDLYGELFDVLPGEVYNISASVASGVGVTSANFGVGFHTLDKTGTTITWNGPGNMAAGQFPSTGAWTTLTGQYIVPPNSVTMQAWFHAEGYRTGTNPAPWYFTQVRITRASSAELIVDGTITATQIAASTITGSKIAAGTITASNLVAGTVTANEIAGLTITGSKVAAGTITGTNIAAATITASNLVANTITAGQIAANTITGANIAAGTIAASNITAGTITGDRLLAGTVTATQIAAGAITATQIAAGAITASNIDTRGLSIKDASGTIILQAGVVNLPSANITPAAGWLNSNVAISGGAISGIGTGNGTIVDNSLVGGVNLIPFAQSQVSCVPGTYESSNYGMSASLLASLGLRVGDVVTFSVDVWQDATSLAAGNYAYAYAYENTWSWSQSVGTASTTAQRFSTTGTLTAPAIAGGIAFGVYHQPSGTAYAGTVYMDRLQLERGPVATTYKPGHYPGATNVTNTNQITDGANLGLTANYGNLTGTPASTIANSNITVYGGAITGIGTGSGTVVDNSLMQMLTLINGNGMTIQGNTAKKTGGTNAQWDSSVYSKDGYTGGAFASAVAISTGTHVMFGLNTDPVTDNTNTSIDFAIYLNAGSLLAVESSVAQTTTSTTYAVGDVIAVTYDGVNVRYYQNGNVIRTVAANITTPLYFDSSFYETTSGVMGIQFGPQSSNTWISVGGTGKPADNATVGADSTNLNVGMGTGNLLSNSGPFPGNAGGFYISQWSIYYTPVAATGPTGYGGVTVSYGGPGTGYGSGNYKTMYPSKVGVRANARYEASVYLSVPGTNGGVYGGGATLNIDWYDSSNAFISTSTGNNVTTVSSGLISTWNRSAVFTNAPANAVTAQVYVNRTGTTYPEMSGGTVMSCWYFGEALAAQTGFSTWSEGSLAMITPANKATYIAALAVDTLQIAGNAVTIPVSATAASAINFSTLPALTYYTYVTSPSMTVDGATPISINGVINQLYVICPAGFNYVCCQLIATNTTTLAVTSNTNPAVQSFNVASTGYYLAPMSVSWVTTLPIGTYTFAMKIFVNLANTNLNVYAGGSISAIAMKK